MSTVRNKRSADKQSRKSAKGFPVIPNGIRPDNCYLSEISSINLYLLTDISVTSPHKFSLNADPDNEADVTSFHGDAVSYRWRKWLLQKLPTGVSEINKK